MKNHLFFALTAAFGWVAYFAAWVSLRCLEISLADKCRLLDDVSDIATRADMRRSIQILSLRVEDGRNRLESLRPTPARRSWRSA